MTRDHDEERVGQDPDDGELRHRLDQTRAELTGHLPVPDQRLGAMFATGHVAIGRRADEHPGRRDPGTDGYAVVLQVEPAADAGSGPPPRRRMAVISIAAAFLLVVGLAVYAAAGRGDSDVPVETAAGTTEVGPLVSDEPDDPEGDQPISGDDSDHPADPSDDPADDLADDLGEWLEGRLEDSDGFFGFGFSDALGPLFSENREWFECMAGAVEEWVTEGLESHAESDSPDGEDPGHFFPQVVPHFFEPGDVDIEGECGEPVIAEGFVWPDLELPDGFELPFLHLPDFDGFELPEDFQLPGFDEEFCEKTESDDGISITCRWPPGRDPGGDEDGGPGFGFGFEFDPDFDLEELEGQLRDRFGDLEERLEEQFGEFESWLWELERHPDGTGSDTSDA
jgi:hypothetical protein